MPKIKVKTKKKSGPPKKKRPYKKTGLHSKKKSSVNSLVLDKGMNEVSDMIRKADADSKKPVETAKSITIQTWMQKYSQEEAEELYSCVERLCRIVGPHIYEDLVVIITSESGIKVTDLVVKVTGMRSTLR